MNTKQVKELKLGTALRLEEHNVEESDSRRLARTTDSDGGPSTRAVKAIVDEDGLFGGSPGGAYDVHGQRAVVFGSLGYDFGDVGGGALDGMPMSCRSGHLAGPRFPGP